MRIDVSVSQLFVKTGELVDIVIYAFLFYIRAAALNAFDNLLISQQFQGLPDGDTANAERLLKAGLRRERVTGF